MHGGIRHGLRLAEQREEDLLCIREEFYLSPAAEDPCGSGLSKLKVRLTMSLLSRSCLMAFLKPRDADIVARRYGLLGLPRETHDEIGQR